MTIGRVHVLDVAPYSVTVRVQDNGAVRTFSGVGKQWFTADMDIDFWGDYLLDFTVRAEARDTAGNVLDPVWEKKVEGLFAGLLKFLEWLGSIAAAIADLVMKALSFIVDLIISIITSIINLAVSALVSAIEAAARPLAYALQGSYSDLHNTDSVSMTTLNALVSSLASNFIMAFGLLGVALEIVSMILLPFTLTFGMLLSLLVSLLVPFIINALISAAMPTGLGGLISGIMGGTAIDISAIFAAFGVSLNVPLSPSTNGDGLDVLLFLVFDFGLFAPLGSAMWEIKRMTKGSVVSDILISIGWGMMASLAIFLAGKYLMGPWVKFFGAILGFVASLNAAAKIWKLEDFTHKEGGKFYKKPRPVRSSWHSKIKMLDKIMLWLEIAEYMTYALMAINLGLAYFAFTEATR